MFGDSTFDRYIILDCGADKDNVLLEYADTDCFWVEETKRKIGEASRNIKKVYREFTCPHCNYTGRGGNMKRYHFDNCKRNPESAN